MFPVASLLGLLVISMILSKNSQNTKVMTGCIRSGIILLWPLLSQYFISTCSSTIFPMSWMLFAWGCDSLIAHQGSRKGFFELPPSALAGLALGLSGLVGNKPSSQYSYLFVTAILVSFLFCVPINDLDLESSASKIISSIQQGILHLCIALVISGCILTYSINKNCISND